MNITAFACPPKSSCEHLWDKWVPIVGMCRDCYGVGKPILCLRCKGTGEEKCGETLACSLCGLTKFDQAQWESA